MVSDAFGWHWDGFGWLRDGLDGSGMDSDISFSANVYVFPQLFKCVVFSFPFCPHEIHVVVQFTTRRPCETHGYAATANYHLTCLPHTTITRKNDSRSTPHTHEHTRRLTSLHVMSPMRTGVNLNRVFLPNHPT